MYTDIRSPLEMDISVLNMASFFLQTLFMFVFRESILGIHTLYFIRIKFIRIFVLRIAETYE